MNLEINKELKDMVFAFSTGGDQEGRLTSLEFARLVIPACELSEIKDIEEDYLKPKHFAESILNIDKIITISNDFYDKDNLERKEMIDGKGENDIIHGFQFFKTSLMDRLGYSIVMVRESDDSMERVWYTKKSYKETLEQLRNVPINPIKKLDQMWWDTSKIPDDDGNIEIFIKYLEESPEYEEMGCRMFYDYFNSEWYFNAQWYKEGEE
jgi:hypothetical protein